MKYYVIKDQDSFDSIFGVCSKSEYVIFKLKEMGTITDNDVEEICKQFDALEYTYNRKITITDLMEDGAESCPKDEHHEPSHTAKT